MVTEPTRHDLELRGIADADDARCPDDMHGCVVASYNRINDTNATYTEATHVSLRLPLWTLAWFDGGTVTLADLTERDREWLQTVLDAQGTATDMDVTEAVA